MAGGPSRRTRRGTPTWVTGRPGWHIECTAIAEEYLGLPIDVQGGGSRSGVPAPRDVRRRWGRSAGGSRSFARHYVHAGMVGYQGHKMSKSRGNLVLVRDLRAQGRDPMAIRLALLAHHYRADWEWSDADLVAAQDRLDRGAPQRAPAAARRRTGSSTELREALADDLAAPRALAAVDRWCTDALAGRGDDAAAPARGRGGRRRAAGDRRAGLTRCPAEEGSMRYAMTGATGFIGSALARELAGAGHDVTAVVRDPAAARSLADRGVRLVRGDVGDVASMIARVHRRGRRVPRRRLVQGRWPPRRRAGGSTSKGRATR